MPRIQHKRGTSANLASVNPTPLAGELVWDSSENAIKIGDGATAWTSLAYVTATPRTHTHSADAITSGTIDYARLPVGSTTSTVCSGDDARLSDARSPTAHKASHATGGSDALSPADIGAAPAASPAITGNATFSASSGVPVTITNTGTGNSFVVNDAAGDTTPFVVDADGRVGVQTASPTVDFEIGTSSSVATRALAVRRGTVPTYISNALEGESLATATFSVNASETSAGALSWSAFGNTGWAAAAVRLASDTFNSHVSFWTAAAVNTNPSERARIDHNGRLGIGTQSPASALDVSGVITVSATSGSAGSYLPSVTFSGDANTGFGQVSGQSDTASIFTAGHERVRVDADGRVGVQTASPTVDFEIGTSSSVATRHLAVRRGTAPAYISNALEGGSLATATFAINVRETSSGGALSWSDFGNTGFGASAVRLGSTTLNSHVSFWTAAAVNTNPTERMRVKGNGAVRFVPLSADPASGEAGDVYYNSSTNKLRVYNGTSWIDLH